MYIKDNLKKLNKGQYLVTTLVTTILAAAMMVGCGTKVDSGAETATETVESLVDTDVGEPEVPEETVSEEDLPALAYQTDEERWWQGKPEGDYHERKNWPSNQFFMIEEVINEPEGGWPEDCYLSNGWYIALKGTLYEVYFYDEPDYDLVYFPGDELPEGYEVRVTRDYVIPFADDDRLGEGHEDIHTSAAYLVKADESGNMSYEYTIVTRAKEGVVFEDENGDKLSLEALFEKYGRYIGDILLYPGMYVDIVYNDGRYSGYKDYKIFQYLTKDDLEALPEGVTLADDVVHY